MRLSTTAVQEAAEVTVAQQMSFPSGLIGFPGFTRAEVVYQKEQLPFMWLKGAGAEPLSFIVVEPAGFLKDYEIEITDPDVEALGLEEPADALVLAIATLHKSAKKNSITLNLIGPIVANRRTLQARQIIIGNCQKYSARHPLFETTVA